MTTLKKIYQRYEWLIPQSSGLSLNCTGDKLPSKGVQFRASIIFDHQEKVLLKNRLGDNSYSYWVHLSQMTLCEIPVDETLTVFEVA